MIETMRLEVPQDILAALKVGIQDFTQYMRIAAAVACFQEKKLSLGKAAQLAGCNRLDFLDLLAEKKALPCLIMTNPLRILSCKGMAFWRS